MNNGKSLMKLQATTSVNKKQSAGSHNVEWDATEFVSGIYFYRLTTNTGFLQSRRLVLLK